MAQRSAENHREHRPSRLPVPHQPQPKEIGGSSNLAGEELDTPTATAVPTEPTATTVPPTATAPPTEEAISIVTETAVPEPPSEGSQESDISNSGIRVQSVLAAVLGLIGALAFGGAIILFIGRNR